MIQPLPILYVSLVDLAVGDFEVRIYLFLYPGQLHLHHLSQLLLLFQEVYLTCRNVRLYLGSWENSFTLRTFGFKLGSFKGQVFLKLQCFEVVPALWALLITIILVNPLLYAFYTEDMFSKCLAISNVRVCHELQANTAQEFIMILLVDQPDRIDAMFILFIHSDDLFIMQKKQQYTNTLSSQVDNQFHFDSLKYSFEIHQNQPFDYSLSSQGHNICYFQMNYQEHRNYPSSKNLPSYNPIPNFLQTSLPNQSSQYYMERQPNNRPHNIKIPFNLKDYSYEMKQYLRPQPTITNTPLTFNMPSPTKLKAKKGNRPSSKMGQKSFANPFTNELESEFFKNQPSNTKHTLDDFSKTTSTINGQSFVSQPHTFTEPSEQRIYTPLKPQLESHSKMTAHHSNSLKILFQRNQPENKNYAYNQNQFSHSNSSYLYPQQQTSNSKSRDNPSLFDQKFLIQEIKGQKAMIDNLQKEVHKLNEQNKALKVNEQQRKDEKELRNSRKYQSKQLQLQIQQNSKLLVQIQSMEKDLKGKLELNRYLEHQCNMYNDKHDQIKKQYDLYKSTQQDESTKQEQLISALKKQVKDLSNEVNYLALADKAKKDQISQLKKTLQLQGEKQQELLNNNEIDKSQINVMTKRLQNFQTKYQKLMHNHCETEIKYHHLEEMVKEQRIGWQQKSQKMINDIKEIEQKYHHAVQQKQDFYMQATSLNGDLIRAQKDKQDIKNYYQGQYESICRQLSEKNKISAAKVQQNEYLSLNLQQITKQNESLHFQLNDSLQKCSQLRLQIQQNNNALSLLSIKTSQCKKLQQKIHLLQADHLQLAQLLQQKTSIIHSHTTQITQIKQSAQRIQSTYKDMSNRYETLMHNYEAQSIRYKDMQAHLIQNQFDYTMLQKDFSQYSIKYSSIKAECDGLRQYNNGLQAVNNEIIAKSQIEYESLQAKNKELSSKNEEVYEQYQRFKQISQNNANEYQTRIQQYQTKINKLNQQYEAAVVAFKQRQQECQEISNKMSQIQIQFISLQRQHQQLLAQLKQKQKIEQIQVLQSQQDHKNTEQLLANQLLEIQSLKKTVQNLQKDLLAKSLQLVKKDENNSKELVLIEEIGSLMLIIKENQTRDQSEKHEFITIIEKLNLELSLLNHKYKEESEQYKEIISKLKEHITELEKQKLLPSIDIQLDIKNKQSQLSSMPQSQNVQIKQWNSYSEFNSAQSLESPSKMKKFESAHDLQDNTEIDYIQMDRQGINYLCELLQIQIGSGNLLNQIVVKVQNAFSEIILSRKAVQSYRKVLQAFGIQESVTSYDQLMTEITIFKENMTIIIQQLKQEQMNHQALRNQFLRLQTIHQNQQLKNHRTLQQLNSIAVLNSDLNETILSLTARMCNQRLKLGQAMQIAKSNGSSTSIPSEKFVTARSFVLLGEADEQEDLSNAQSPLFT